MLAHIQRSLIHSLSTPLVFTEGRAPCTCRGSRWRRPARDVSERETRLTTTPVHTLNHRSQPSRREGKAEAQGGSGTCVRHHGKQVLEPGGEPSSLTPEPVFFTTGQNLQEPSRLVNVQRTTYRALRAESLTRETSGRPDLRDERSHSGKAGRAGCSESGGESQGPLLDPKQLGPARVWRGLGGRERM